jgi:uncharacterized membrane protein
MAKSFQSLQSRLLKYDASYNFLGNVVGMIFVFLGFLPTLLPRGWVLQGVLSGVVFTIGYGIGVIISYTIRSFNPKEKSIEQKNQIKKYAYVVLLILYLFMMIAGFVWQQEVRKLVEQQPATSISALGSTFVAILLIALIMLIARSIRTLYNLLKRLILKYVPKVIALTAAWIVTALIVLGILNGIILSGLVSIVNQAFSVRNGTTDSGIVQPNSPQLSGSSESLVAWDSLGRQGRNFIGKARTTEQLNAFNDKPAMQPIRIYSGLESASSTEERAKLATDDLKRAGGFGRDIIVVATTTGTGWVDEEGVAPIEYMYNGDSAIVSMQYSYLPSWLSFLVDQTKAKDAGAQLYKAVYDELQKLPEASRPKIVVFGESLGSFGGEAAFADLESFKATSDGAVWAGPPNFNELRKSATEKRDSPSPEILPIFQSGQNVRFAARSEDFNNPDDPWGLPRVAYLENPSDPIVWWTPSLIFNKPDWLREPRGADVSQKTKWIPIITFWGVTGDMVFSTGVPDGHGHKYGKLPTDAWSFVAPPSNWSIQKTEDLKAELSK